MKTKNFTFVSCSDSLPISVLTSMPDDGRPAALLQLAHGMCGCKERFLPFMEYMADNGIGCVANDHRGHGESIRSSGDLGYMYENGGGSLVEDMAQLTSLIYDAFPGTPVFLLGHSMGSMAARVYTQRHDDLIDGLILCGSPSWTPFAHLGYIFTGAIDIFGGGRLRPAFLSDFVSRQYNRHFSKEGPRAWTCSDPEIRKEFENNPKCNYTFTINGMLNLMELMLMTYRSNDWQMYHPDMPVLFLSGEDDPCSRSEKMFHESAKDMCRHGYGNVSSALYRGMRHEILNEKEKENVWNDILLFIKSNIIC